MDLRTDAFAHEGTIPGRFAGDGPSPAFRWARVPAGTQAFAFIVDDPDAPGGTWVHWALYDLPASATGLEEGRAPAGAKEGRNSWGRLGYGGPAPPSGRAHRYYFRLYALDAPTGLPPGAEQGALERAMKGHLLAEATWMGTYRR